MMLTIQSSRFGAFASGIALFACLLVRATSALAQTQAPPDPREAKPERPTVATHAYAVAPGIIELETGVQWQRPDPSSSQLGVPALFKIGLIDRVQLDVSPGWVRLGPNGSVQSGLSDFILGIKYQVLEDAPLLGNFAIQPTIKLSTGSVDKGTGTGTTDATILLISSHSFGDFALDINVGYTRRSGDGSNAPKNATMWTISAGMPVGGPVGFVAELFGYPGTSGPTGGGSVVAFLTGPTLTVQRWFVLDAGVILNLQGFGGTAVYGGLTWNMGRMWTPKVAPAR